jgi:ferrous iron transport protein B
MPGDTAVEPVRVALVGLPNVGKTTLFNELAGQSLHTSNFHGTTQEAREAVVTGCPGLVLIDLPGTYTLGGGEPESVAVDDALRGQVAGIDEPQVACVVIDHTNLTRGIRLLEQVRAMGLPATVLVHAAGRRTDVAAGEASFEAILGVPTILREGSAKDVAARIEAAARSIAGTKAGSCGCGCSAGDVTKIAEEKAARLGRHVIGDLASAQSDRADDILLHPVSGLIVFTAVMWALFWSVFRLAAYPMDWIDQGFALLSGFIHATLPAGAMADMLADGVVAGVGATVVFLPQIALLFFLITLLEESGYLARGALLADRLLRPFGLPGTAFVPLLSAHACAIPAIVATRTIRDVRERVATILIAPFMSCSARIPVYALLVSFLFVGKPTEQATAFIGCYVLGIVAALFTAMVLRRTILRSASSATVLELPAWRVPSLRRAMRAAVVRSGAFLRKAGTTILVMMIALWWLSAYPVAQPGGEVTALEAAAAAAPDEQMQQDLEMQAQHLAAREAVRQSYMGRIGRTVEPVFAPLGYDWQLSIGIMTSFAAREVFVSTMAVVTTGEDRAGALESMRAATRDDGSVLFDRPTLWSLLVFFVLAMQCMPTMAVVAREAGGVKWSLLQFAWMSGLAYIVAFTTYSVLNAIQGGG